LCPLKCHVVFKIIIRSKFNNYYFKFNGDFKSHMTFENRKMLNLQHQHHNYTTIPHMRVGLTYWSPPLCEGLLCGCCDGVVYIGIKSLGSDSCTHSAQHVHNTKTQWSEAQCLSPTSLCVVNCYCALVVHCEYFYYFPKINDSSPPYSNTPTFI
jgi:hypothetical protein